MHKFKINKAMQVIIIGDCYVDVNAARAFLENPEQVVKVGNFNVYPLGAPDPVDERYSIINKGDKWSSYCPEDTPLAQVDKFFVGTKQEVIETLTEALEAFGA